MTAEQQARDMLERMGVDQAQSYTAGDLVELANLIAERDRLANALDFIGRAGALSGGELFPVGPAGTEYAEDRDTVLRYIGPWQFDGGKGDSFLDAVEDAMRKD